MVEAEATLVPYFILRMDDMYLAIGYDEYDYEGCSEPRIYGLYSSIELAVQGLGKISKTAKEVSKKYWQDSYGAKLEVVKGWYSSGRGGATNWLILKLEIDEDVK